MILVSSCSCLCPIHWSQVLSREWRRSQSSADRRGSNYNWVINSFIVFSCAFYIRGLTVLTNKHRQSSMCHDDVIKWKNFPCYWPFVRGIHRSQWRGALVFSLIYAWINNWVNNREAGDLRRHRDHYDVNVMYYSQTFSDDLLAVSLTLQGF